MSPDTLHHGPVPAGRLRIYLGYAPGAGTTCAMLSEGHRRAERGTDVVVASARTHGRAHTPQACWRVLRSYPRSRSRTGERRWRKWIWARCWPAGPRWRW